MKPLFFALLVVVGCKSSGQAVDTAKLSYAHYIDTISDVQWYVSVRDTSSNLPDSNWQGMPMSTGCHHDKLIHLYGNGYSRWYLFYHREKDDNPDVYYIWQIFLICYKQYGKPYVVAKTY
jgi:hypothetical protein